MASFPLVSIVVPVHNGLPFIESALKSITSQSYPNLEIIVVDNASTDGTSEFLSNVPDDRVKVIYRNSLQSAPLNWTQAINESRGHFVKLVCADDLITVDAIEVQVLTALANPNCTMICTLRDIIGPNGKILKSNHGLEGLNGYVHGDTVLRKCMIAGTNLLGEPAAVLFDGEAIRNSMPWVEDRPYLTDLATYQRVLSKGAIFALRKSQASFRISSDSWSANILSDQPKQFAAWRDSMENENGIRLNPIQKLSAILQLRARTIARRIYFKRIQHDG